jgi:hypothetical protein
MSLIEFPSSIVDLKVGLGYFDSRDSILSLFRSVPSLTKLNLLNGLPTPLLLALKPLSHLTVLHIEFPWKRNENHIDYKDWIWSLTQLKHLSLTRFTGALPAMHAPNLTCLYIKDWKAGKEVDDEPVDQLWRACPSLVRITLMAPHDAKNEIGRLIKPPWYYYTSSDSKISSAKIDCRS